MKDLWRLVAAVLIELIADLALLVWIVLSGKEFLLPTAVIRLVLMGSLGALALRGRNWARWCFATLLATTAVAGIVVGLVSFSGGIHFVARPSALGAGMVYGLLFMATAFSPRNRERPLSTSR